MQAIIRQTPMSNREITSFQSTKKIQSSLTSLKLLLNLMESLDKRVKQISDSRHNEMMERVRTRKHLLMEAIELFNGTEDLQAQNSSSSPQMSHSNPKACIRYLADKGVIKDPQSPQEIALFFHSTKSLNKRVIGDYISNRANSQVMMAYIECFDFNDQRIDQALRQFLEAFRLPGEAPLISILLDGFAAKWHKLNGQKYGVNSRDAAFTLAYSIIMLNVDQHNHNVKRQFTPMDVEQFKQNLKGMNTASGEVSTNEDFDSRMLEEIYHGIKNQEIVMPSERQGQIREDYHWKVLTSHHLPQVPSSINELESCHEDIFICAYGFIDCTVESLYPSTNAELSTQCLVLLECCLRLATQFSRGDVINKIVCLACKLCYSAGENVRQQMRSDEKLTKTLDMLIRFLHMPEILFCKR
ncbi:hypothetical protein ACOME3_002949 [Neoechinorhynchus agilis]